MEARLKLKTTHGFVLNYFSKQGCGSPYSGL